MFSALRPTAVKPKSFTAARPVCRAALPPPLPPPLSPPQSLPLQPLANAARRHVAAPVLVTALWSAAAAWANENSAADISFEQLASMQVSGVSKSAERVLDAPAAVTIITAEQIRSFGYHTLAEVLNTVPGFSTYTDRAYTYASVQGFAPIEGYNSRVLLLIDGFPANDDFFQNAAIGTEQIFDLDLVDRVEVIRGPSSSVYGNSAFFGVINVVLKSPTQLNSGAQAWVGSGKERGVSGTLSAVAGEETRYFLRATESGTAGTDVVFPPQSAYPAGTRVSGVDGYDLSRAFAKITSGNLRINLDFSERRERAGFGLYGDVQGYEPSFVRDGAAFADVRYDGAMGLTDDYSLRASLAEYRYDSDIGDPNPPSPAPLPNTLSARGDWIDTEGTVTHRFSASNRLVMGVELRRDMRENATEANPLQGEILRIRNGESRVGLYAQSDIDWSAHWSTSLGVREDYDAHQQHLDPRLALLWKPSAQQVVKLMYGTALREATAFEKYFAQPPYVLADPALAPERVRTLDAVYENQIAENSRVSVTAFRYSATNLITDVVVDPVIEATQYQNAQQQQARGVDLGLEQRLVESLSLHLNASYVFADDASGNWVQNAPKWSGRLGLERAIADSWTVAAEELFSSQRLAIDNTAIPGYALSNFTLTRRPHAGRVDCSFSLYNAFNRAYAQPVAGWAGDRVDALGRTWRAAVGYSF